MKRFISLTMAAVLMGASVSACGFNSVEVKPESGNDKVEIVTTIFPEYDWVKNVLGENPADAEVTMLIDKGVDLHSFQPTADDIIKISSCDMFVYVGGESDEWVADALKEAVNKDMVVINLLDCLGDSVKEEEVVEGMQEEEHDHDEEDHDHENAEEKHDHENEEEHHDGHESEGEHHEGHEPEDHDHHHEEGEIEYDEHVWLSLRNAETLTQKISEGLQTIDHANAETYKKNAADYIGKLQALDADYQAAVDGASVRTLLFGDRFPFRYMVDDYGLDYFAAFVGCSAETEASFETVSFLSKKVDELSLPAVMTIEGPDHRIAETIVQNTGAKNQKILTLDSMQATTGEDVKNGTTYLSVMENNLSVLKEALD
ncbi:zinc ABC transporter substrate-binding protein [Oribacterium sp. C9]|uniref:metal ABC transporter substrate-binding protein n=1 Tax=Oribacterium sp. C9 TaxID=1943579 RepID=UPI0009CC23AF|nr:metal ABC transporter substrate-binding protein [Oribacterium sp. C9]OON87032.1 zinc ABC transporter substrate-binding protein [Oribacterium sp. C9]